MKNFTYEEMTTIAICLMKQRYDLGKKENDNNAKKEIEKINSILGKIMEEEANE
jgi:hypothetical protein